jgi:SAM-dependent methyltransferase
MDKPDLARKRWFKHLACPRCRKPLRYPDESLICDACSVSYPVKGIVPIFLNPGELADFQKLLELPDGAGMRQEYADASAWVKLVKTVRQVISSEYVPYPPDLQRWITELGPEALILEVGSGPRRLTTGVINLDIGLFPNVDIVGDGASLPFLNGTMDFIILDVVLEHVKQPYLFIREARRVLRTGGLLYLAVPFVHPYHGYPADYQRFSTDGLQILTEGFARVDSGVLRGPMVAMLNCLSDLPFIFTFSNSIKTYQITKGLVLLFTFWLKYLDKLLVKNPQAHRLAHCLYFLGRKLA